MLLSNRRLAFIYFCLAGMEIAWFTPLLLLVFRAASWSIWPVYLGLLAALVAWMLALEILSRRQVRFPRFELAVLGLIAFTSLALVRVLLYAGHPPADLTWLAGTWAALGDFSAGLRPEWALVLVNFFLWQRAASASSRDIGFFSVGISFRLGMLLMIFSAALYGALGGRSAAVFLWIYFALGLAGAAVARIHESAVAARSAGAVLPPGRLAQLLAAIALTLGLVALLSLVYTVPGLRTAIGWLQPLWDLFWFLFLQLLEVVFWLLLPVLLWLGERVRQLDFGPLRQAIESLNHLVQSQQTQRVEAGPRLPAWVGIALRDLGIALVVVILLGAIWLYLEKIRLQRLARDPEQAAGEPVTFGGDALGRGRRRLQDLAALVRHYGLGSQLLAAVSVQNIYANLCRLARRRGYPRRPAQPPDDYLPMLVSAFAGHDEALARITAAYMAVHYGDRPVTVAELARLRADYREISRARPATEP